MVLTVRISWVIIVIIAKVHLSVATGIRGANCHLEMQGENGGPVAWDQFTPLDPLAISYVVSLSVPLEPQLECSKKF